MISQKPKKTKSARDSQKQGEKIFFNFFIKNKKKEGCPSEKNQLPKIVFIIFSMTLASISISLYL